MQWIQHIAREIRPNRSRRALLIKCHLIWGQKRKNSEKALKVWWPWVRVKDIKMYLAHGWKWCFCSREKNFGLHYRVNDTGMPYKRDLGVRQDINNRLPVKVKKYADISSDLNEFDQIFFVGILRKSKIDRADKLLTWPGNKLLSHCFT